MNPFVKLNCSPLTSPRHSRPDRESIYRLNIFSVYRRLSLSLIPLTTNYNTPPSLYTERETEGEVGSFSQTTN